MAVTQWDIDVYPAAARGGCPGPGSEAIWLSSFAAGPCRPPSGPFFALPAGKGKIARETVQGVS